MDEHLRIGTILTDGDPRGAGENRLGGVDVVWNTSTLFGDKNFAVAAWGAWNQGDLPSGRHRGWGAAIDYPNDRWDLSASVNEYGDGLDPALGFIPRPGTRQYRFGMAWQPRPPDQKGSWIRQYFFELFPRVIDDLDGDPESWRIFTAPFNAETRSGMHLEANWTREFERIDEPFEIEDGIVVRWTIRPEADLFVVWNRGWKRPLDREDGDLVPLADQLVVKLEWIFRR